MSKPYDEQTYVRHQEVEGVNHWTWVTGDTGAWDGPVDDWVTSHKKKYFENLKDSRVVVQAGGNLGLYPRFLSDIFKVVYTFEPDPLNFFCLAQNCQKDNIIKLQGALGDSPAFVNIQRNDMTNVGMHTVSTTGGCIPQFTVDQFNLPDVDAILLDVEGYELAAILGAAETIRRCKPIIVAERGDREEIRFTLEEFGYKYQGASFADHIYYPRD